jgi:hypothetical protein
MNQADKPEPVIPSARVIDHAPLDETAATPPRQPPLQPPRPVVVERRGGSGGAIFLNLLLSAGLGAAGYYAWTNPNPDEARQIDTAVRQAQAASDQAATLAQQLQTLSSRVEKLEQTPPPPAPPPPAPAAAPSGPPDLGDLPKRVDDLAAKVDALANRPEPAAPAAPAPAPAPAATSENGVSPQALADLDQRVSQAFDAQKQAFDAQKQALAEQQQAFDAQKTTVSQLAARVDQLTPRIGAVSQRVDQLTPRLGALEQGVGRAKGTVAESQRVARVESALVDLQAGRPLGAIPDAPPALVRFATVAPPTEASLREEFPALAEHAQKVSQPDLSGRSFWQRALTRMQSAVTVRQGGDVIVGDPASGILADARAKVQDGDLPGALTVLRQLSGPAAVAMKGWVDQASALVAARAALADLAAHA